MGRTSSLTTTQWAQSRRRWEGSATPGFQWLVREITAAWGATPTRAALGVAAKRYGWLKGGPVSSPLAAVVPAIRQPRTAPAPAAVVAPAAAAAAAPTADTAASLAIRLTQLLADVPSGATAIGVVILPVAHRG